MFREDFAWGVAASAYQMEGRDPQDGCGRIVWDGYCEAGKVCGGHHTRVACDHMHRYREDFALMRLIGVRHYRFSINWARILPQGVGQVNEAGVELYRDMIKEMLRNGITPYLTLFHWEYPQALQDRGGWMNPESADWFAEYARVVAERFSDLCEYFITFNEPECFIGLGYYRAEHAPGWKVDAAQILKMTHNVLRAHGKAVKALRAAAVRPIQVGIAPTCGVAIPASESEADIEAARKTYFAIPDMANFTWNIAWYADPVLLGHYPEEGVKRFTELGIMPEIGEGDMELISQPLDFMGHNVYNGYYIRCGADGEPEGVPYEFGSPKTASQWPVTPSCIYWGSRFLYERYHTPMYITENGMSCHDMVSADGRVHDGDRIEFLERYLAQVKRAIDEGADIRGYFLWTFLDNFEWDKGYTERFGLIYVDFATQKRIVKDSAYWYKKVCETNGACLAYANPDRKLLALRPVLKENVWGGRRLAQEFGYETSGEHTGECWAISAHPNGDCVVAEGTYAGMTLSELYGAHRELFGNLKSPEFPLLVKIIDAQSDLSIQVHPDDAYAAAHENGSLGKTECWYVMDCPEDASLVIGHHAKTREELKSYIAEDRYRELIREVPVRKGDFLQIEPGTVHAIKGGFLILETQQSSDITYRVYDYDRLVEGSPRQLHVAQSIEVINVPDEADKKALSHAGECPKNELSLLASCRYYKVWKLPVEGEFAMEQEYPFLNVSVLSGDGIIDGRPVRKGDHFLVPSGYGRIHFMGAMELILSTAVEE